MSGPANRVPPEWPTIEYEEASYSDRPTPKVVDKYADDEGVSYDSRHGLTLDSTVKWGTHSYSLRYLWENGFLTAYTTEHTDGTTYYAQVPNAGIVVAITKQTYDAIMGLQYDDSESRTEYTALEQALIDATTSPDRVDAIKMVEHGPGGTWPPEEEVE